jgi:predicted transcriptional regulator
MKKSIPRRDILKIYGDLLSVLKSESNTEKVVLTHVQIRINVPFDRLKNYIIELKELGLIDNETSLKLTDKGKEYLKEYEKVLEFMKRMGFTYQYQKRSQGNT